jgi:type IV pilus assembly protein PilC
MSLKDYIYKVRSIEGKIETGILQAESRKAVLNELAKRNLIPISVEEESKERKVKKKDSKKGKVTLNDLAIFCRQFSTMIAAGIPIAESLYNISRITNNVNLKKTVKAVHSEIEGGSSLSRALEKYPKVFNKAFISLVIAGEEGGHLDKVLLGLASYLERTLKLKRKIKAASMYPIFIFAFTIAILGGMMIFIVPKFKELFDSFGADLPLPTKIIVGISDFIIAKIPFFIVLVVLSIFGLKQLYKNRKIRYTIDKYKLKLPIFGDLISKVILIRFFNTLGTLLSNGVSILSSLELSCNVTDNLLYEQSIDEVRSKLTDGAQLSAELSKYSHFPEMAVRLIMIGEKSGKTPEMMNKVSEYYDDEVNVAVDSMSSLIEPVMIVVLGFVVGIFIITMYLPIFKIAGSAFGGG